MIVILKKSPRLGGFLIALLSIFLFSCDYNKGKENIRATVTINDFNTLCYPVDDPHSTPVGAVLAITKSSLAWWKENLDNAATDNKLPAVVVADAAGALTGFTIDAIVQTGKFIAGCADQWDWASSGFAALGGAIDGSIGISAKVGKGIATIIKGLK